MRIRTLGIDGYGCFTQRELELHPGLQVIIGPNEQGKTTLRYFICDMLYGQKLSVMEPAFTGEHDLRRPWEKPETYAGRLVYELDAGRVIEVVRNFDETRESVRVFDRTRAEGVEITSEFPMLRNREPMFADKHLGISKTVFLSSANIGHMSLDHLGDTDALAQIRERILALSDSGAEDGSADAAVTRLEARIAAIGRPNAHTKPLPMARARLAHLQRAYEDAVAARAEVARIEGRRRAIAAELANAKERRRALEADLKTLAHQESLARLREAEHLASRLEQATQQCFSLASVRTFPVDRAPEAQRLHQQCEYAEGQLERTESEWRALTEQIEAERARLGAAAELRLDEISEEYDRKLAAFDQAIARLRAREEELAAEAAASEALLAKAQAEMDQVPDFSRLSADPIAWLNQLATSFRVAQRVRDDERERLEQLYEKARLLQAHLIEPARILAGIENFPAAVREYELNVNAGQEEVSRLTRAIDAAKSREQEFLVKLPGYLIMLAVSALGAVVFLGGALVYDNPGAFIPAAFAAVAALVFFGLTLHTRGWIRHLRVGLAELRGELVHQEDEFALRRRDMDNRIAGAGLKSIRELEAYYDDYRDRQVKFLAVQKEIEEQQARTREEDENVARLLERLRETFSDLKDELAGEDDVPAAAARAIARYQEYRDTKRRYTEARDRHHLLARELARVRGELKEQLDQDRALSLEVRQTMRDNGFMDESHHASALNALRAYRMRSAQIRQKRGRLEVLQEKAAALEQRLERERRELEQKTAELRRALDEAGVDSYAAYQVRLEQARAFREARTARASLEEQLGILLRGEALEAFRARLGAVDAQPPKPGATAEAVQAALAALEEAVEALRNEDRELELAVAEHAAALNQLNALEEERTFISAQAEALERELEAAAYAAALIEEVARERHALVAPKLAERASAYFREITDGAYKDIVLNRELDVGIRFPETGQVREQPDQVLSKGTLDQIYFALRVAVVQTLSERGEHVPMLLDDPFANYDDRRLARVMRLLAQLGAATQILVFSCREDVARAAQEAGAPVVHL